MDLKKNVKSFFFKTFYKIEIKAINQKCKIIQSLVS